MKKILFSLKTDFNGRSDAVGLPLIMLLYAELFGHLFKYKIEVFDPFFEADKHIKDYNFKIVRKLDMNLNDYDRIINPLFYVSSIKVKNSNKIIRVEGRRNLDTKINYKKNELRLIQRTGLNSLDYLNKFNESKSLDIPYEYYLEWLFRDKFISKIKLKKKITLPLLNKNTFAIQFDYFFKRDPKFALNLVNKIKEEDNNSNIIIYGQNKENYNDDVIKLLNEKNCFFLEDYSNNPLVRGLILGNNTNYYISKSNGFTDFAITVGRQNKKMKRVLYVDSLKNSDDIINIVRRNLKNGILENKISKNSFYFNKVSEFHYGQSILNKKNIFKKINPILAENEKSFFIGYSTNTIKARFFSNFFDELINEEMLKDFNKGLRNSKLIFYKNNKFYDFKSKKIITKNKVNFKYASHILSHYNLVNNEQRDKLLNGSLDFSKPDFLKKLIQKNLVNPGNLFYDDLFSYFIRKSSNKNFKEIDSQKKVKKILVLTDPFLNKKKNNRYLNYIIKKFNLKTSEKERHNWSLISSKVYDNFKCELIFFYIKEKKLYLKIDKKIIKMKLSKNNLMNIFKKFKNIICFPNELSLMAKFLATDKNNLLLLSKQEMKKDLIDYNKKLFTNDFKFKYSDLFDMKFNDPTELFLFIFKIYIKFN